MNQFDREILKLLYEKQQATISDLAKVFGITRQALQKRIKKLIEAGYVGKIGRTRGSKIFLTPEGFKLLFPAKKITKHINTPRVNRSFRFTFKRADLTEEEVFDRISRILALGKILKQNALHILRYVFTEIYNNAIDHSDSQEIRIKISLKPHSISVSIRDEGIGIFKNLKEKLHLKNESEGIIWLIPGKTTTLEERHTGEGIFFSSKVVKEMTIKSHSLFIKFMNYGQDILVGKTKGYLRGTAVEFEVLYDTKKKLVDIFEEFAPVKYDYKFEISKVIVKILSDTLISRSQARRIVEPLQGKFREIIFDFKNVRVAGQGFLDELLRVFPKKEKGVLIVIKNVPDAITPLLHHIEVDKEKVKLS